MNYSPPTQYTRGELDENLVIIGFLPPCSACNTDLKQIANYTLSFLLRIYIFQANLKVILGFRLKIIVKISYIVIHTRESKTREIQLLNV